MQDAFDLRRAEGAGYVLSRARACDWQQRDLPEAAARKRLAGLAAGLTQRPLRGACRRCIIIPPTRLASGMAIAAISFTCRPEQRRDENFVGGRPAPA
ncbi:hypothetical protein LNP74_10585 [Klebsiella pneumoniae subsp. pneumoniae]|nr:hypothetical protein [Klebsiella pneumoniae subsp. pneumoniae]